jgi:hypothetical protein
VHTVEKSKIRQIASHEMALSFFADSILLSSDVRLPGQLRTSAARDLLAGVSRVGGEGWSLT